MDICAAVQTTGKGALAWAWSDARQVTLLALAGLGAGELSAALWARLAPPSVWYWLPNDWAVQAQLVMLSFAGLIRLAGILALIRRTRATS
jgi:hypothetical protein